MNKNLLLSSLAALLVAGTGVLSAAESAAEKAAIQKRFFDEADTNHNGQVTEREFAILVLRTQFNNADGNKDGKVTKEEYMKNMEGTANAATIESEWKMMDRENKGHLVVGDMTRDTIAMKDLQQQFKKLDKTGTGYVTMATLPKVAR